MDWDEHAAGWDDDPAVVAYANAAFASLQDVLRDHGLVLDGARVLDFGCGTGRLTALMAAQAEQVVGYDVSAKMVAGLAAKALGNVRAVQGSLSDVGQGFDGVTCSSVCAFVPDYPQTVRDLVKRIEPGGWFVQWDWELDPDAEEPFGLSPEAIQAALSAAGLVDVAVRTGFEVAFEGHTMAPVMAFGRVPGSSGPRA